MYPCEPYYINEIEQTIQEIQSLKEDGDLCFAAVSDSYLHDTGSFTCQNIAAVDQAVHFDFLVHLGDILPGTNPQQISRTLLRQEICAYQNAISSKQLYVTRGDHDGWRDESFVGQLVNDIMLDPIWYADTACSYSQRIADRPYYYSDFPKAHIRCIFLSSNSYEYSGSYKMYEKLYHFSVEQLVWLKDTLDSVPHGFQVLLFSHALPNSRFESGQDLFLYGGRAGEKVIALLQDAMWNKGLSIVGWIAGHYRYDWEGSIASVNHILIGSQAPLPKLGADVDGARFIKDRIARTSSEDLWDAFLVKPRERKIYAFRFGAGENRILSY